MKKARCRLLATQPHLAHHKPDTPFIWKRGRNEETSLASNEDEIDFFKYLISRQLCSMNFPKQANPKPIPFPVPTKQASYALFPAK